MTLETVALTTTFDESPRVGSQEQPWAVPTVHV